MMSMLAVERVVTIDRVDYYDQQAVQQFWAAHQEGVGTARLGVSGRRSGSAHEFQRGTPGVLRTRPGRRGGFGGTAPGWCSPTRPGRPAGPYARREPPDMGSGPSPTPGPRTPPRTSARRSRRPRSRPAAAAPPPPPSCRPGVSRRAGEGSQRSAAASPRPRHHQPQPPTTTAGQTR